MSEVDFERFLKTEHDMVLLDGWMAMDFVLAMLFRGSSSNAVFICWLPAALAS